jgi:hypothetical protein
MQKFHLLLDDDLVPAAVLDFLLALPFHPTYKATVTLVHSHFNI